MPRKYFDSGETTGEQSATSMADSTSRLLCGAFACVERDSATEAEPEGQTPPEIEEKEMGSQEVLALPAKSSGATKLYPDRGIEAVNGAGDVVSEK